MTKEEQNFKGYLWPYVYWPAHPDPLFEEFTYGDIGARGRKLKTTLNAGDFIFFWTNIAGRQYITAYYVVSEVVDTKTARQDKLIRKVFKNPHFTRKEIYEDDVVVFGDPEKSRKLGIPLLFDKRLADKLSLEICFSSSRTEAQNIGSACRQPRKLTEKDVKVLLDEIEDNVTKGKFPLAIPDWHEKEIESVLTRNPELLEKGYKIVKRKIDTGHGEIDLLFEDQEGNFIVTEVKEGVASEKTLAQVLDYKSWLEEKHPDKKIKATIVCATPHPRLQRVAKELNVLIYVYGGKFYTEKI